MPDNQSPVESTLYDMRAISQPGVRRDGTPFGSGFYQDAQWTRFQRGLPRKMGGYRAINDVVDAPVRCVLIDSRDGRNRAHLFSPYGVEMVEFDNTGAGAGSIDRTPAGFTPEDYTWQADTLFDAAGSGTVYLVATAAPSMTSIDDETNGNVYYGNVKTSGALTILMGDIGAGSVPLMVSGGIIVLQPYCFLYGNNGLIQNSKANDITSSSAWTPGIGSDANLVNVSSQKVVKGLPVRGGGQSPAGLFWALDSLIRVTFTGSSTGFRYDPQGEITVLSSSAVVEYDGIYYWPGVDRFYMYAGVVAELPNDMNLNWFFDNLNPLQRQKIWAIKMPRWGEIWWLFPFGDSMECDHAVIYNVREKLWYDTRIERTTGARSQVFTSPVMVGGGEQDTVRLEFTGLTGGFSVGDSILDMTSGAVGVVVKVRPSALNLVDVSKKFKAGHVIVNSMGTGSATLSADEEVQAVDVLWRHETGVDQIRRDQITVVEAHFETSNFQFQTGGPVQDSPEGTEVQTRLSRIEPDFIMEGKIEFVVRGTKYAQSDVVVDSPAFTVEPTTEHFEPREQRRLMSIKVTSNARGSTFEMGRTLLRIDPGDKRP